MKLLLIKPPSSMHLATPPMGLAYLSAVVKKEIPKTEIKLIDCPKLHYGCEELKKIITDFKPDVLGMTAFSFEILEAFKIAELAKKMNKETIVVLGGPHVSSSPEAIRNESVDFIFRGECENSFPLFLKEIDKKEKSRNLDKIKGLGYKKNDKLILNNPEVIQNLDSLPFPDHDLIDPRTYPRTYQSKRYPIGAIFTSRGCPYQCAYCSAHKVAGRKWRSRSPENILEEIKFLKKRYGIKEIQIWDDNFTVDKERVMKFCDLMIKEKINIEWWCPNGLRMETLDAELLGKMKQAGLYAIDFGIESGSEKVQKDIKKNLDFKKLREVVRIARNLGIRCQGFFIIGFPTETKEDIIKTANLAKELKLTRAFFFHFQPLIGSEIYETLKQQGKLPKCFSPYEAEYSKTNFVPEKMNARELENLYKKALFGFYLRPKIMLRFISENLSPQKFKSMFITAKRYVLGR